MPNSIQIRMARPSDSEALAKVHTRSWQSASRGILSDDWLAALRWEDRKSRWDERLAAANAKGIFVAVDDHDDILGFTHVGPVRDSDLSPDKTYEVYAIYIDPSSWRAGIGSALLSAAMSKIPSEIGELALWVLKDNLIGKSFYERKGFSADGAEKFAEIGPDNLVEVRYKLALTPA